MEDKRLCGKCKEYKPLTEFTKVSRRKDGLSLYCKSCVSIMNAEYRKANKDELNAKKQIYRKNNPDKIKAYTKEYINREDVKKRMREYNKKYIKEHYDTDELYRFKLIIRADIYSSVTRQKYIKKRNMEEIVGCSIEDLISHLKQTYYNNYGVELESETDYQIDHIIPLASANSLEEVIKLCHYTNLQLLRSKDNREKSAKINWKL